MRTGALTTASGMSEDAILHDFFLIIFPRNQCGAVVIADAFYFRWLMKEIVYPSALGALNRAGDLTPCRAPTFLALRGVNDCIFTGWEHEMP